MSSPSTTRHNESAYDLFDRWLAHREKEADAVGADYGDGPSVDVVEPARPVEQAPVVETPVPETPVAETPVAEAPVTEDPVVADPTPVAPPPGLGFETAGRTDDEDAEVIQTEEEFEEFAHPALGGAAGAPSSLGTEAVEEAAAPLPATTRSPVTAGALAATHPTPAPGSAPAPTRPPTPVRRPTAAPPPGLVLFSPRRGARHILTGVAAVLAGATGIAGYLAWQAPTSTSIGVAAGLAAALFLAWKLRGATNSTAITIEHGMLRVVQGHSVHQFPLAGSHPQIDVLGEPGRRSWKVLIQRRGMPPYVITRRMVDPVEFTDVLRHFRPDA